MSEMEELLNKMKILEAENIRLKSLLEKAGIDFAEPQGINNSEFRKPKSFQSEILLSRNITYKDAQKFYSYFWGRTDVYSNLSVKKHQAKKHIILNAIISGKKVYVQS